ncbi:Spy/CpxP family protein refolding chaperone [Catalinimonas alkaloidigena]|uniref:hypothetical protein n=1 Tax=Catalinimonas alkaloidigena TaxID=1075417 RepID=UPI0024074525|nr:hypothetical protein [Catalinimonas alkaloidigena]MDF9799982.1 Spy/CpxP family protein refolding chaperone [Catalinimonas alkaloidigena]
MKWNILKSTFKPLMAVVLLTFWMSSSVQAQGRGREGREKLESAKIAHITERLSLTPETAQKFWPIYNQLSEKERELRKKEFEMRRNTNTSELTEDEAQTKLDQYFELKEEQLALEKEAAQQYQDVLTPKQVLQLFKAEADFHRMILEKFGERRRGGGPPNR